MEIEVIDAQALKELYDGPMQQDFPADELRPYDNMKYLMERGAYRCFVCKEQDELLAYALFSVGGGAVLLDYYAVNRTMRGKGVGTRCLKALRERSAQFGAPYALIEAESVESARTPAETEERERRLRFYSHCGCRPSGVFSTLFGVEFQILVLPFEGTAAPAPEEVKAALEGLYRMMILPIVEGDEEALHRVSSCFLRAPAAQRSFERDLSRSLTFLYRHRRKFMSERLREYSLSGVMYMVVLHVSRHPGATQDSIATHMCIDKSNVARRVKQLEDLHYLRRETDPADRRQNNLFLTPEGEKLLPVIRGYLSEWGHSVTTGLSVDEREQMRLSLEKVLRNAGLGQ